MPAARQGAKRAARGPRFGRRAATHFFLAVSRAQTPVAVEPTLLQARVQAGAPNAINALANALAIALANAAANGAGVAENLAEAVRSTNSPPARSDGSDELRLLRRVIGGWGAWDFAKVKKGDLAFEVLAGESAVEEGRRPID